MLFVYPFCLCIEEYSRYIVETSFIYRSNTKKMIDFIRKFKLLNIMLLIICKRRLNKINGKPHVYLFICYAWHAICFEVENVQPQRQRSTIPITTLPNIASLQLVARGCIIYRLKFLHILLSVRFPIICYNIIYIRKHT